MANLYVLLDADVGSTDLRQLTDVVEDNGGRVIVFLPPQLAIVEGDDTTHEALEGLVGGVVLAHGFEDVTKLAAAAAGSKALTESIAILALTTTAATDAADRVRRFDGEVWPGFSCIPEEA